MDNPIGSAVGFAVEIEAASITTPGVPVELTAMLPKFANALVLVWVRYNLYPSSPDLGIGESTIQELVNARSSDWPEGSCSASGLAYRSLN